MKRAMTVVAEEVHASEKDVVDDMKIKEEDNERRCSSCRRTQPLDCFAGAKKTCNSCLPKKRKTSYTNMTAKRDEVADMRADNQRLTLVVKLQADELKRLSEERESCSCTWLQCVVAGQAEEIARLREALKIYTTEVVGAKTCAEDALFDFGCLLDNVEYETRGDSPSDQSSVCPNSKRSHSSTDSPSTNQGSSSGSGQGACSGAVHADQTDQINTRTMARTTRLHDLQRDDFDASRMVMLGNAAACAQRSAPSSLGKLFGFNGDLENSFQAWQVNESLFGVVAVTCTYLMFVGVDASFSKIVASSELQPLLAYTEPTVFLAIAGVTAAAVLLSLLGQLAWTSPVFALRHIKPILYSIMLLLIVVHGICCMLIYERVSKEELSHDQLGMIVMKSIVRGVFLKIMCPMFPAWLFMVLWVAQLGAASQITQFDEFIGMSWQLLLPGFLFLGTQLLWLEGSRRGNFVELLNIVNAARTNQQITNIVHSERPNAPTKAEPQLTSVTHEITGSLTSTSTPTQRPSRHLYVR